MKKFISVIISFAITLGVSLGAIGCAVKKEPDIEYIPDEFYVVWSDNFGNDYKIDVQREKDKDLQTVNVDMEYLACYEELGFLMQGIYAKDGTPLDDNFIAEDIITIYPIDLSLIGTKNLERSCRIRCTSNGQWFDDYRLIFNFIITVQPDKSLHKYVTIPDVEIPYGYFACDMQEVYTDSYDLDAFQDMLGVYQNKDDFEYGRWSGQLSPDGTVLNYSSDIWKQQTQSGVVWGTEAYHHVEPDAKYSWEIYQYRQMRGNNGYILNETDGVFIASTFTQSKPGVADSGWSDYMPSQLDVVKKGTDVTYRAAEKEGYLYLCISGVLQDFFHSKPTLIIATYKIQGNKIVAWLYEEYPLHEQGDEYWRTVQYCIPLVGEIELLDENYLGAICNR